MARFIVTSTGVVLYVVCLAVETGKMDKFNHPAFDYTELSPALPLKDAEKFKRSVVKRRGTRVGNSYVMLREHVAAKATVIAIPDSK